jgi:hypothetical protein
MAGVSVASTTRRWILGIGVAFVSGAFAAGVSRAETTTERSSSILVFPKIIFASDAQDTLIQITNTSNSMVHAHCFYVNAAGVCDLRPSEACRTDDDCGPTGPCIPQWQEVDFDIWLTKQQPTHWAAGFGRFPNLLDRQCSREAGNFECDGAGIDPGRIPPVADPFYGELKCIEVDQSGAPISGNHLKGEATLITVDGDASKYNAVGILGEPLTNDGNTTLCLGGEPSDLCPSGAEYSACPDAVIVNHFAERADNPLLGPTSEVRSELTLVPCEQDFELQRPVSVVVQFAVTNEFEQTFSGSTTVQCWGSFFLNDANPVIFDVFTLGSRVAQTFVRPSSHSPSAVVGVLEEFHSLDTSLSRVALNLHEEDLEEDDPKKRLDTDFIILPAGP